MDMYAPYESEGFQIDLEKMPPDEEIEDVDNLSRPNNVYIKSYRLFISIVRDDKTYEFQQFFF